MISAPLELKSGHEYRCFVFDGNVCSVSRLVDFEIEEQNSEVTSLATQLANDLLETSFVRSYSVDFALTHDNHLVIVDLNPIGICGRYVNNRVDWMMQALYGKSPAWDSVSYAAFQTGVDVAAHYSSKNLMRQKAEDLLAANQLTAAEAYFREFLLLPGLATFEVVGASLMVCRLLRGMSRYAEALQFAQKSVEEAKQEGHENNWALLVSMHEQARCLLSLHEPAAALEVLEQAFQLQAGLDEDNLMRATMAVLKAECLVHLRQYNAARDELILAERLYEDFLLPAPSPSLLELMADWWSVTAKLKLHQGDGVSAKKAWQEAVDKRQSRLAVEHTPIHQLQYADALYDLQAVCRAFGEVGEANQWELRRREILNKYELVH